MSDPIGPLRAALSSRYAFEREVGQGAFATVYLARDLRHGREVAIKVLAVDGRSEESELRFLREVRLLAGLQHPNILPLHDSGHVEHLLYYVMPYVRGSVRDKIARERRLSVASSVQIAIEVADALYTAHRNGVVHRDVKPENILLAADHAIVADFGVAAVIQSVASHRLTKPGLGGPGTPAYMSPEQILGTGQPDPRNDIYALGCVLYEMLTGKPPFGGKSGFARRFTEDAPRVADVRPEVPEGLDPIIAQALARDPADRFADAGLFAKALRALPITDAPTKPLLPPRPAPPAAPDPPAREPLAPEPLVLEPIAPAPPRLPDEARRRLLRGTVAAVALLIAAAGVASVARRELPVRRTAAGVTSPDAGVTLIVAPFAVIDSTLGRHAEGILQSLSRNLDGAGLLRTVSPSSYARGVPGGADRASALALARRMQAVIAIFGTVERAGQDSVRARATLLHARRNEVIGTVETHAVAGRIDLLTDSLTVAVLRALAASEAIGGARTPYLRVPATLEAFNAFLTAEQLYRLGKWDSARVHYERTIAADSLYPLPHRRLGFIMSWLRTSSDSLAQAATLRAGALNRGLGPRDSLLVLADSLMAAATAAPTFLEEWPLTRRLFAILEGLVAQYPVDAEAWFTLGEARYHFGSGPGRSVSAREALEAFDRAIAIDSGYLPAYLHTPQLALAAGGPSAGREAALRYVRASLARARNRTDRTAQPRMRLVEAILTPRRPGAAAPYSLDTIPGDVVYFARNALDQWPDSAETALALTRFLATGRVRSRAGLLEDEGYLSRLLASQLALRGHVRESERTLGDADGQIAFELPYLVPDAARLAPGVMRRARAGSRYAELAPAWWGMRGDTLALLEHLARGRATTAGPDTLAARKAVYDTLAALAHLALARGDSSGALERMLALPDSLCPRCHSDRLARARLVRTLGRGDLRRALADMSETLTSYHTPFWVLFALERGRIARALGERETAERAYSFVVEAWWRGDPEVQGAVAEARRALSTLGR